MAKSKNLIEILIGRLRSPKIFIFAISVIAITALVGGAFYFGYQEGLKNPKMVIVRGVTNLEQGKPEAVDFNLFWYAWEIIKEKYIKSEEIDNQDLLYGAISGLLNSLNDPNSVFMPPSDAKKFTEDISGEFSGIGAEIDIRNEQLIIVAPLKNTPAYRAGLEAGDKILKVDNTLTFGLKLDEAVKIIRGPKGTTVVLTILRNGWDNPKEIPIVRDIIQIPTLDWEIKEDKIAHIQLYNFYENAPFLFYQAAVNVTLQNSKGIILDLRNNPGGYLEVAVNIAGWFLEKGRTVVTEEFRSRENQIFNSPGPGLFKNLPVVILINKGSASASEILAGALRDQRGIKLIGNQSFGKGTVQELELLSDGSVIKITTAHWRLPGGQLIEKNGLMPDYEVKLSEDDIKNNRDPQLEKAMEILKMEIK